MESFITSSFLQLVLNDSFLLDDMNDTSSELPLHKYVLNDTREWSNITRSKAQIASVSTFCMCLVGMPGNLLVIAVCSWKLTTSTRLYMFALAVADLAVCSSGIFLTTVTLGYTAREVTVRCIYMAATFSVFILAFVSIERLLAVRRPFTFSLSLTRAKIALAVIAVASAACTTVVTIAGVKHYTMLHYGFAATVIAACVLVMVLCYALMAMTLLMKIRSAHRSVGVSSSVQGPSAAESVPHDAIKVTPMSSDVTSSKPIPVRGVKHTTTTHNIAYKDLSVLLAITVVFIICWLPRWLAGVIVAIPTDVINLMYLNSAVNPFIYGGVSRMFRDDTRAFYRRIRPMVTSLHR